MLSSSGGLTHAQQSEATFQEWGERGDRDEDLGVDPLHCGGWVQQLFVLGKTSPTNVLGHPYSGPHEGNEQEAAPTPILRWG